MFTGHSFLFATFFLILGWFAHYYQEGRRAPGKRSRALPRGTEPKKTPGRPRKPKAKPEKAGSLGLEDGEEPNH